MGRKLIPHSNPGARMAMNDKLPIRGQYHFYDPLGTAVIQLPQGHFRRS
ncbi:MAG: hypothetical protein ACLPXZ_13935 [Mycobacterium sp.]